MADLIRNGVKKGARDRKNGASREAWALRKLQANLARGKQETVTLEVDSITTRVVRSRP
jgi:hypothetical protein